MKKLTRLLILFIFLANRIAIAQETAPSTQTTWSDTSWADTPFKSDKPYEQARKSIDTQIMAGVPATTIATKLDKPYELNDALNQFKWGYATYEAARKSDFPTATLQAIKERVNFSLRRTTPGSAEFARLLFLTYSRLGPFNNLNKVGQRLVKKFPRDFEVKYFAFYSLSAGRPSQYPIAVAYAKDLKQMHPTHPKAPFYMAHVYESRWGKTWAKRDANKVINEYRSILKTLPMQDSRRTFALSQIRWVQAAQPQLEKNIRRRAPIPKD